MQILHFKTECARNEIKLCLQIVGHFDTTIKKMLNKNGCIVMSFSHIVATQSSFRCSTIVVFIVFLSAVDHLLCRFLSTLCDNKLALPTKP